MPILLMKANTYSTINVDLVISIVMFEIRTVRDIMQVAKGTNKNPSILYYVFVNFILSETATVQGLPVEPIGMSNLQNWSLFGKGCGPVSSIWHPLIYISWGSHLLTFWIFKRSKRALYFNTYNFHTFSFRQSEICKVLLWHLLLSYRHSGKVKITCKYQAAIWCLNYT